METRGSAVLQCEAITTAGISTSIRLEQSIDDGANWFVIDAASVSNATTSPTLFQAVINPIGRYRTNVTGCGTGTNCTFKVWCREERQVGQSW